MKKLILPTILALGLVIGACNSNGTSREQKVRSNGNRTEMNDRSKTDSTSTRRDKTIQYDNQGNVKKETQKTSTDKGR